MDTLSAHVSSPTQSRSLIALLAANVFMLMLSASVIGFLSFELQNQHTLTVAPQNVPTATPHVSAPATTSKHRLVTEIMNQYSASTSGDLSIYFKNLTTEETIALNGETEYYMASLYKVILVMYIHDKIQNQEVKLTDKVPGTQVTIETALEKIITESNNEYAQALANRYGWENIETAMKAKLGIEFEFDRRMSTNVIAMGTLFENLARAINLKESESSYLLRLLNQQKRRGKLPKYLPDHIYTHNKTGELEQYSHDAGIFYTPKANYILVFMSKTPTPAITNELMAQMSKDIYEALNEIDTVR